MTITIPIWALYALGGVVGLLVLVFAAVGVLALMCADVLPGGRIFTK